MGQLKVLILESGAVDRFSTSAIVIGKVASLTHEIGDHPVEAATLVAKTLLPGTKGAEVFRSLGNNILPQLHHDAAHGLVVRGHVEENAWQCHFLRCCGETS